MFNSTHGPAFRSGPETIDIGNVETRPTIAETRSIINQVLVKKVVRSGRAWQRMLVLSVINEAAGPVNTMMRYSRLTMPRMAMLISLRHSQKTERPTKNKIMHSYPTIEKGCPYRVLYSHRVEYNQSGPR